MKKINAALLAALALGPGMAGGEALAGGGGCGDVCDEQVVLLACTSNSLKFQNPAELNEADQATAESLGRKLKPGSVVRFYGISWSLRPFDPAVLQNVWIPGLFNSVYSDQLEWPRYDYTQGYRIDPQTGAFEFAGISGWDKVRIHFQNPGAGALTELSFRSIESGRKILAVQLACGRP